MMMAMIVMLGAAAPSGENLKGFLEVVTYLVVLGVAVKSLLSRSPSYAELATKEELERKADQRDFERLEKDVKKLDADLETTERRIIREVKEQGNKLSEEIKEFANEARNGRVSIWEELNRTRDKIK